ncbi:hypothetical protein Q7P37_006538 [Cladosporium fusiforme]
MLSRIAPGSRIPALRPRRPPSANGVLPRPRPFTQHSKLQLLARHSIRPQLPYLSQPHISRRLSPLDQQVLRLLSTETKRYVIDQSWLAARWTAIAWTFAVLAGIAFFGIQIELDERRNPTPAEWTFWTRNYVRGARFNKEGRDGVGIVDWARVGSDYLKALLRLESATDGKDLVDQVDGEGIVIPDVGKAGLDISGKSWEWRAGYFEVLMGCAEAAERMSDMVLDTTRGYVYPKEIVIGPSNPDPRPPAPYMGAAPLEENVTKAFDAPESFYMRVLTGKGFTTKQRLEAAWKYAAWLETSGLDESAEEMYKWAVDIAKSNLSNPDSILDPKTFLLTDPSSKSITADTSAPTSNILSALTKLGAHTARRGDVATGLPILLSVLRAHRAAPISPNPIKRRAPPQKVEGGSDIDAAISTITSLFTAPVFPAPPPSGDTPVVRETPLPTCEEGELMLYIGEILFATSPASSEGLSWTKQATQIASANLDASSGKGQHYLTPEEKQQCKSCFRAGVSNWETMLLQLASKNVDLKSREGGQSAGWFEWRGWFGGGGSGVKGKTLDEARMGVLEAEMQEVEILKEKIAKEVIDEDIYKHRGSGGGGVWVG